YYELGRKNYSKASACFRQVVDGNLTPRFFLHWYWQIYARLGLTKVALASGDISGSRREAGRFLRYALSTADPNLHALAWQMNTEVAIAEEGWNDAKRCMGEALSLLERFHIPLAAWQVYATASRLGQLTKDFEGAEAHRLRQQATVRAIE